MGLSGVGLRCLVDPSTDPTTQPSIHFSLHLLISVYHQVVSLDALRSAEAVPEALRCPLCRKLMEEAVLVLSCDKASHASLSVFSVSCQSHRLTNVTDCCCCYNDGPALAHLPSSHLP